MAYTLTFASGIEPYVNGVKATSGMKLHNGDVIVVSWSYYWLKVNGKDYGYDETITITDSNINLTEGAYSSDFDYVTLTINFVDTSVVRLSVDISTLAGWANLSAGEKNITIVAKASGYKDSAPSAAVQVTKAASTKTLKAGTYKWKDNLSIPDPVVTYKTIDTDIAFSSNGTAFTEISVGRGHEDEMGVGIYYYPKGNNVFNGYANGQWGIQNADYDWTAVPALQTITLATDQQVSADFYEWAITGGNLVAQPSMPAKGDIITLDSKQYRVLKTEGTVAEVLAMYDSTTSQQFGSTHTYENSDLDIYCNTIFYNSLSSAMQNAIVAKTFQQDSWQWTGGTSAIANYIGTYQSTKNYTLSLMTTTFGSSINRKCYVLSCQDVIDYLGVTTAMTANNTTLTDANLWKMFWNQTTSPGQIHSWLRSNSAQYSSSVFDVAGRYGFLPENDDVSNKFAVRPAFQIDLSKISWS